MNGKSMLLRLLIIFPLVGLGFVKAQDCTQGECHSELQVKRVVHLPVEDGDCESCHQQVKKNHPKRRGAEMALTSGSIAELCTTCHEPYLDDPNLHPPVNEGQCTTCHDPHESDLADLIRGPTVGATCNQCHDTGTEDLPFVHGPVAVGACTVCHSGHGSVPNALLKKESVNATCYDCHELKQEEIEALTNAHEPVQESCTNCHSPHASENEYQLMDPVPDLCLGCHGEIDDLIGKATSHHEAVESGKTCNNCHLPHGSNYANNLRNNTFDLCLDCHNKPMKVGKVTIPSMKKFLSRNTDWHGPVREKDCSGCHQPHGSENIRLLRYFYPRAFYAPFFLENYQLCFQCHPNENVLDPNTTRMTNFRDGDRNLHFLHVNRDKGRTCRACHQTHASNHPFHIRDTVPFGSWEMPLNYEPLDDGGRCTPGCHKTQEYRRK